jgi:hypothetical protein
MNQFTKISPLLLLINLSSYAATAPKLDINNASREFWHPVTIHNTSKQMLRYRFRQYSYQEYLPRYVMPNSSDVYHTGFGEQRIHFFVDYMDGCTAAWGRCFATDRKFYNTALIKEIHITSSQGAYTVTCLDGGSESCVAP